MTQHFSIATLFASGEQSHDCASITVTKNDGQRPTIRGPGELKLTSDGIIVFKCFAHDEEGREALQRLDDIFSLRVGKPIPRSVYYSVKLITFAGKEWLAENVYVEFSHSFPTGQVIATGKLAFLKHVKERDTKDRFLIRMLLYNQNKHDWDSLIGSNIQCGDLNCTVKMDFDRETSAFVEVSSTREFSLNFETRILEALRYVLGKIVHVSVLERSGNGAAETTVFSLIPAPHTRLMPPLQRTLVDRASAHLLFERYLSFVAQRTSAETVYPCSASLRFACDASANGIEAEISGLCLAIEEIANLIPYERSSDDDASIETIQTVVERWLKRRAFNPKLQKRANGLLGQLKNVQIAQRLEPLVESGHLDSACLKTWKKSRPKAAHPKPSKPEEFDDQRFGKRLEQINRLHACLYQITFALIEYKGKFSNYAADGFPVQAYPLAPPPSLGESPNR